MSRHTKALLLLQQWEQAGHCSVHENFKEMGKSISEGVKVEEEVQRTWLWQESQGLGNALHR